MALISVTLSGFGRLEALAQRLQDFAASRQTLLRQLGQLIRTQHQRRVLSEKTSPDGAAWAKLKPYTVRKKGNSNILVETGRMAKAWNLQYGGDSVRMTNGTSYLHWHQGGTSRMVARPVMGFSGANLAEIAQAVQAFVASRLGA